MNGKIEIQSSHLTTFSIIKEIDNHESSEVLKEYSNSDIYSYALLILLFGLYVLHYLHVNYFINYINQKLKYVKKMVKKILKLYLVHYFLVCYT